MVILPKSGNKEEKRVKCCICGSDEGKHGIPFSFCDECGKIIEKYLKVKTNYEETMMLAIGIMPSTDFDTGIEDVNHLLKMMSEHLAQIRFRLAFMENCMTNIQTELKKYEM